MTKKNLLSPYLIFSAVLFAGTGFAGADMPASVCLESLDKLLGSNAENTGEKEKFPGDLKKLAKSCPEVPHIQHNLAVLHANKQDWPAAIEYFEKSLAADKRAQQSFDALARIYRFQAVKAYRDALQSNSPDPSPPSFTWQDSRIKNFQIESFSNETNNNESLRKTLNPLVENWWRETILADNDCKNCFTEAYAGIRANKKNDRNLQKSDAPDAAGSVPDFLVVAAADSVIAVVRDPDNRVYSLRLRQTATGWRIDEEQKL